MESIGGERFEGALKLKMKKSSVVGVVVGNGVFFKTLWLLDQEKNPTSAR